MADRDFMDMAMEAARVFYGRHHKTEDRNYLFTKAGMEMCWKWWVSFNDGDEQSAYDSALGYGADHTLAPG